MSFDNSKQTARDKSLLDFVADQQVIYPGLAKTRPMKPTRLFLLGSMPGEIFNPTTSWRVEARNTLRRHGFDGTILSPELHGQDQKIDQGSWHRSYFPHANRFVVWFDEHSQCCDEAALFRLGQIINSSHLKRETFIGWANHDNRQWLKEHLEQNSFHVFSSLSTLCQAAAVGTRSA